MRAFIFLSVAIGSGALVACHGESLINTGCPPGALCALHPTLVLHGQVRASANPLSGVLVTLTAFRNGCAGSTVTLLPSPAEDRTDSLGMYRIPVQPTESVPTACLRVAYFALVAETNGVALHVPPAAPETLRVDLTGP
jgi:hypothetical protein